MRSDRLYLADMLDAIGAIERFMQGLDQSGFLSNELVQSAVLQKLSVIGEAAARVPPAVPWKEIVGFRNIAVHAYFSVDWRVVHVTVTDDLPPLKRELAAFLQSRPSA